MHLSFSGSKLHRQGDAKYLIQLFLVVDRLQRNRIEGREFTHVMRQPWLGDGNGNVVGQPISQRFNNHRPWRIVAGGGHAHAFGFELIAQHLEQVARAKHLQRLRAIRSDGRHKA